ERSEEQRDPAGDDGEGQYDHKWAEDSQGQYRRALLAVGRRPQGVASELPEGAPHLEQNGGDQKHANEHMGGDQAMDLKNGHAFGRQQHEEHRRSGGGQAGVALSRVMTPLRPRYDRGASAKTVFDLLFAQRSLLSGWS